MLLSQTKLSHDNKKQNGSYGKIRIADKQQADEGKNVRDGNNHDGFDICSGPQTKGVLSISSTPFGGSAILLTFYNKEEMQSFIKKENEWLS
ncbi:hypothetical protein GH714_008654 [Hevea brasiliensis]|uniref:Uncharacterized protein n=1 Tax=Hevea brasiliensis TaxID=3981 RepID=A0A6A6LFA1_HEVBR|nr:hypothetical protein GH714_008654 [Hevea brasiliensis]